MLMLNLPPVTSESIARAKVAARNERHQLRDALTVGMRRLSSHRAICRACNHEWADVYVVSDAPHKEESRCAECGRLVNETQLFDRR